MIHPLPGISPGLARWKRRAFLAVVFCSSFTNSFACKCEGQGSILTSFEGSTVVFTGTVLKVEYFGLAETIDPDSLTLARTLPHDGSKNFLDVPTVLKAT